MLRVAVVFLAAFSAQAQDAATDQTADANLEKLINKLIDTQQTNEPDMSDAEMDQLVDKLADTLIDRGQDFMTNSVDAWLDKLVDRVQPVSDSTLDDELDHTTMMKEGKKAKAPPKAPPPPKQEEGFFGFSLGNLLNANGVTPTGGRKADTTRKTFKQRLKPKALPEVETPLYNQAAVPRPMNAPLQVPRPGAFARGPILEEETQTTSGSAMLFAVLLTSIVAGMAVTFFVINSGASKKAEYSPLASQ
jgi:hypothetical protein